MPPRYAYWTIIIDDQPTAFRSAAVEELIPTFNRLKSKQPNAVLKWFQDGKLWDSRLDAREANIRKRRDERPRPEGRPSRPAGGKLEWQPKGSLRPSTDKPKWQPKGASAPSVRPKLDWSPRGDKPRGDKPSAFAKASADKSGWSDNRSARPSKPSGGSGDWRARGDKPSNDRRPRTDKPSGSWTERRPRGAKPTGFANDRPRRGDKPSAFGKASADKSSSSNDQPVPRDSKWRPGGEHRDPRQKYKDAKKAKWTRFKQAIRGRRPPRKP